MLKAPSCFRQTAAESSLRRIFMLSLCGVLHTARTLRHRKRASQWHQAHRSHLPHPSHLPHLYSAFPMC